MKTLVPYLLLLTCWLSQNACKQDADPTEEAIYFSGLTTVDETGVSLGQTDTTDWRLNDVWTDKEKALFPANTLLTCILKEDSLDGVYLYPNPCKAVFAAGFRTSSGTSWHFRWVDEDFKVLKEYDWENPPAGLNTFIIQTNTFPKDTIRMYYEVLQGNCIFRGHGDILIEN